MFSEQKKLLKKLQYPYSNEKTIKLLIISFCVISIFTVALMLSTNELLSKLIIAGTFLSIVRKVWKDIRKTPVVKGVRTILKIIEDGSGRFFIQSFEDEQLIYIPFFVPLEKGEDDVILPYGRCGDQFLLVFSGGTYYALPGGLEDEDDEFS